MRTIKDEYYCHGCFRTRPHRAGRRKADTEYHGNETWVRIVCESCGREQWLRLSQIEYDKLESK